MRPVACKGMRSNSMAVADGPLVVAYQVSKPGLQPAGVAQISDVYVTADGIVCAVDRSAGGLYLLRFEGA